MRTVKIILIVIGIIVIVAVGVLVFTSYNRNLSVSLGGEQPWYAVYLSDGQIYYGHLASVAPDTIVLDNVYYLELFNAQSNQQAATSANFQLQTAPQQVYNLVHRGNDGPLLTDHKLFIDRHAVLFWEKLDSESQVVKLIEKAREK